MEKKYRYETMSAEELLGRTDIYVPTFQRGLCWSHKQKKEYIASCAQGDIPGNPIICVDQDAGKPFLIDFQQRYHALQEYSENPGDFYPDYMDASNRVYDIIRDLIDESTRDEKNVDKIVRGVVEKCFTDPKNAETPNYIRENLLPELDVPANRWSCEVSDALESIVRDTRNSIRDYLDLGELELSVVQFDGTAEDAARNFEKINSTGKGLSKYDIWHARWAMCNFTLKDTPNNNRILQTVIGYYNGQKSTRSENLKSDFSADEVWESRKVDFYDFAIGLGSLFISECPSLCGEKVDTKKRMEIGCGILGIITRTDVKNNHSFAGEVAKRTDVFKNEDFSESVVEAVASVASVLQSVFEKWLAVPGTDNGRKYNVSGVTNAFVLAAFASIWNARYEVDWENERIEVKTDAADIAQYEGIQRNIVAWLVYETVGKGFYGGEGERHLSTFYLSSENGEIVADFDYASVPPKETLLAQIDAWLKREGENKGLKSPSAVTEMMLVLFTNLNADSYKASKYDIEHIFDKKQCSNAPDCLPHVFGNLMYLSKSTNRGKKNISLWSLKDKHDALVLDESYLESTLYPSEELYSSIWRSLGKNKSHRSFDTFVTDRAKKMCEAIVDAVCDN